MNFRVSGPPQIRVKVEKIVWHEVMACQKSDNGLPLHNQTHKETVRMTLHSKLMDLQAELLTTSKSLKRGGSYVGNRATVTS